MAPARATNPVGALRGIPVPVGIALGIPLGIALAALIISGFLNPSEFGGFGMALRAAIFFPVAMFLAGLILFAALGRQMLGTSLMIGALLAPGALPPRLLALGLVCVGAVDRLLALNALKAPPAQAALGFSVRRLPDHGPPHQPLVAPLVEQRPPGVLALSSGVC